MAYLTHGYDLDSAEEYNVLPVSRRTQPLVIVKTIEIYSMCEHQHVPFLEKHTCLHPNGLDLLV